MQDNFLWTPAKRKSLMMNTAPDIQQPQLRSWPQDAFRIGFGLIWLIDAVLKWLPGFRSTYVSAVSGAAQGQPGWLKWWFDFWVKLQTPRPTFFAYLVAVLETLVALAIIFGFARKLTYIMSAVLGVVIWAVAEGFGGPYMQGSSDIGTAIIYAVVSMGLLTLCYYVGASRLSVDYHRPGPDGQATPPVIDLPPVETVPATVLAPSSVEVTPATTTPTEPKRPVGVG
jgi:nitrite reductase (NO-forming)